MSSQAAKLDHTPVGDMLKEEETSVQVSQPRLPSKGNGFEKTANSIRTGIIAIGGSI